MEENIKNPKHIDVVKAVSSKYEGVNAFYMGNILKYLIRADGLEDLKEARVYLNWLIENIEEEKTEEEEI